MSYTQSKYIVGEIKWGGGICSVTSAVLFNEVVSHDSLRPLFSEIHGAGFFRIDEDFKVSVFGKSTSLKVGSRPEDVLWIERTLCINQKDT